MPLRGDNKTLESATKQRRLRAFPISVQLINKATVFFIPGLDRDFFYFR